MAVLNEFAAKISSAETNEQLHEIVSEIRQSDLYKKFINEPNLAKKVLQQKFNPISAINKIISDKHQELENINKTIDLNKNKLSR